MTNIKSRIKDFLNKKKISKLEFYKSINVANGYLDKEGAINSDILSTILTKYPEIDFNWLLFGRVNLTPSKNNISKHIESSCEEKCKLKDYIIDLQKEKLISLESKINSYCNIS